MDVGNEKQVRKELKHHISESRICEAIPDFYEEKCGQFLCPLIPFDQPQDQTLTLPEPKRPKSKQSLRPEESWTYKKFEKKLSNGVLTIPSLHLEHVPKSIFEFDPPLRIVYLNDNALKELPPNIFDDLPLLAWFDIRNNHIRLLPELTRCHEALRTLLLQNNSIIRLPLSLHLAEQLTTIQLRGNPVIDPPPKVVESGTPSILSYLRKRSLKRDLPGGYETSESDLDEAITLLPPINARRRPPESRLPLSTNVPSRISQSLNAGDAGESQVRSTSSATLPKFRALQKLYSDALWRHASHDGPSPLQLLAKAQQEMRISVQRKLACQKEAILQKMRDKNARETFRSSSLKLQLSGLAKRKAESYRGPSPPFGISRNDGTEELPAQVLQMEDFQRAFVENWERLNSLIAKPVPLNDAEKAKMRLEEVEEIQHKISNMRFLMKPI